ncbi:biotinylated protein TB7.3 [Actinomycetes bacterium]|nr:biotinylated protein TB7.3 [Actinomycetes bacterium]
MAEADQKIYTIRAEMVANVLSVSVTIGESVIIGQTVLLLDSMKMEIPVLSEFAGKVIEIAVTPGEIIQEGDPLIMIAEQGK